jgi:hypothetical protein
MEKLMSFKVEENLYWQLKQHAAKYRLSISSCICVAIENFLKDTKEKENARARIK